MPQCDVTVRETCGDEAKIYYFYNIYINLACKLYEIVLHIHKHYKLKII